MPNRGLALNARAIIFAFCLAIGGVLVAHADDGDDGDDGGGASAAGSGASADGGPSITEPALGDQAFNEIVARGLSATDLAALERRGIAVSARSRVDGVSVVRLRVPWLMTARGAIDVVRALNPRALVDHNHYYRPQQSFSGCAGAACAATLVGWPAQTQRCGRAPTIGLIDTAIDRSHVALEGSQIEYITARRQDARPSSTEHGTAVASVLVGAADGPVPGLLPQARLIAVDAFHRGFLSGDRMDAYDLLAALELLSRRGVRVINLSFAGPPNLLLEDAVRLLHRRGAILVAAVGNEGPTAPSLFPAAYPQVVAVTAVDRELEVYYRAGRGKHVNFSAPGVDVLAAAVGRRDGEPARPYSGTSFATPFVTATVALLVARDQARDADRARRVLASRARDLGAPGVDPTYGFGLIQAFGLCGGSAPKLAR